MAHLALLQCSKQGAFWTPAVSHLLGQASDDQNQLSVFESNRRSFPMIPWIFGPETFTEFQLPLSLVGATMFALIGVSILLSWVPRYKEWPKETKERIGDAYMFFVMAALFLVFGLYFLSLLVILLAATVVQVIWKSFRIMRDLDNKD